MSIKLSIFSIFFFVIYIDAYTQTLKGLRYEIEPSSVKLLDNCSPIIEGTLNGKKAFFLVDTGSTITVLDLSQKKNYGFHSHKRLNKRLLGFGGKHMGVWSILKVDMRIGGRFVSTPFLGVSLAQLKKEIYERTGYGISGIIGSDVIRDYGIMVDFVGKRCLIGIGKNLSRDTVGDTLVIGQDAFRSWPYLRESIH